MLNDELEKYKRFFKDFSDKFHTDNEEVNRNIDLKYNHTIRVCKNIIEISKSIRLNKCDINLAEIIALFHDIGRFEQLKIYNTFNDKLSIDHSKLSVDILKRENILKNFNPVDSEMVYTAIFLHNKRDLPESLDNRTEMFSKLIRDADKLDILKVLTEYYSETKVIKNQALELNLPEDGDCSNEVLNDIFNEHSVNFENVKNINDYKLGQISWIFDVNFDYTLKKINEYGYMDVLFSVLPENEKIKKIRNFIYVFLKKKFK